MSRAGAPVRQDGEDVRQTESGRGELDLESPDVSYIVGLLQTDGCHSGDVEKKGKIGLELAVRDEALLHKIAALLPCNARVSTRQRTTNFSAGRLYETATLTFSAQPVRRFFAGAGVPTGRKSNSVGPPNGRFSAPDYVRGLLDGDGSLGFTSRGYPFVSFVTASDDLARYLAGVINDVCGVTRRPGRNARDGVFNIMVTSSAAKALAAWCYYDGCLGLERKVLSAEAIGAWTVPSGRYGVRRAAWTAEADDVVRSLPRVDAAVQLGRTEKSIAMRAWRLVRAG